MSVALNAKSQAAVNEYEPAEYDFDRVHVDFCGPFHTKMFIVLKRSEVV